MVGQFGEKTSQTKLIKLVHNKLCQLHFHGAQSARAILRGGLHMSAFRSNIFWSICSVSNIWKERNGFIFEAKVPCLSRWVVSLNSGIQLVSIGLESGWKASLRGLHVLFFEEQLLRLGAMWYKY